MQVACALASPSRRASNAAATSVEPLLSGEASPCQRAHHDEIGCSFSTAPVAESRRLRIHYIHDHCRFVSCLLRGSEERQVRPGLVRCQHIGLGATMCVFLGRILCTFVLKRSSLISCRRCLCSSYLSPEHLETLTSGSWASAAEDFVFWEAKPISNPSPPSLLHCYRGPVCCSSTYEIALIAIIVFTSSSAAILTSPPPPSPHFLVVFALRCRDPWSPKMHGSLTFLWHARAHSKLVLQSLYRMSVCCDPRHRTLQVKASNKSATSFKASEPKLGGPFCHLCTAFRLNYQSDKEGAGWSSPSRSEGSVPAPAGPVVSVTVPPIR